MRWVKWFREDPDRPAFQIGIERHGTAFVHDVLRVWQACCIEDSAGLREVTLSDEMLNVLARQFRTEPAEARTRIQTMAEFGLIELTHRDGSRVQVISSKELERRRDEWSQRKAKGALANNTRETPEALPSDSGEAPEQSQSHSKKQKQIHRTERNELTVTGNHEMTDGNDRPCSLVSSTPWDFTGVDIKKVPKRFQNDFATLFETEYEKFRQNSHDDGECFCYRDEFLGQVRDACQRVAVEYPKAILARQIELERTA